MPTSADTSPGWTLNECIFRLVGGNAVGIDHRMLVVADPSDRMVAQINALACVWDGQAGQWQPVSVGYNNRHRLRVFVSGYWVLRNGHLVAQHKSPELLGALPIFGTNGHTRASLSDARAKGLVDLVAGQSAVHSEESLMGVVMRAIRAAQHLQAVGNKDPRAKGLAYPRLGLGPNSNAFVHTMRLAMGYGPAPSDFGGKAPYYDQILLSRPTLADISLDLDI